MSFSETETQSVANNDTPDRKEIIASLVRQYQDDLFVVSELETVFPDYPDTFASSHMPDPHLDIEKVERYLNDINTGVEAYEASGNKADRRKMRNLVIGRQALILDYAGHVMSIARSRARQALSADTADFAQETVAALADAIANFKSKDPRKFINYIGRAASNTVITNVRKLYREKEHVDAFLESTRHHMPDNERDLAHVEATEKLHELIITSNLSPRQITIICLRNGIDPRLLELPHEIGNNADEIFAAMPDKGYSANEVAAIIGTSAGALRVADHKAIKKIRATHNISNP